MDDTSTNPSSSSCEGNGSMMKDWAILERFVFRRDGGAKPLPENETTAGSSTCIGVPFRVSLGLAPPPSASRYNLEWAGGPSAVVAGATCQLVAAHRDCILFRLVSIVRTKTIPKDLVFPDDYFIYRPVAADLTRLPTCIIRVDKPDPDAAGEQRQQEQDAKLLDLKSESESESSESESGEIVVTKEVEWAEKVTREANERRLALGVDGDHEVVCSSTLHVIGKIGLLCSHDEASPIVVAGLRLNNGKRKVSGELSMLHIHCGGKRHDHDGDWVHMSLPIQCNNKRESSDLRCFCIQAVLPFGDCLCWVDYGKGIVLAQDMQTHTPKLSYIPLPRTTPPRREEKLCIVCATDGGRSLKFIDIVVDKKGPPYRRPCFFTIISYNLQINTAEGTKWEEEASMTSEELWGLQAPGRVPREVPMFPLVNPDKPHIVHLQFSECTDYVDTVTLVAIDMNARAVVSVIPHIKGEQELHGEDADVVEARTSLPQSFLPVTFSKPLLSRPVNLTRKRKNQD